MTRATKRTNGKATPLKRGASKSPGAGSPIYDELVAELGDPTAWPPKGLASVKRPPQASKPTRSVA